MALDLEHAQSREVWERTAQTVCHDSYRALVEDGRLPFQGGLLKTYFLEVHADDAETPHDRVKELLSEQLKMAFRMHARKVFDTDQRFFFVEIGPNRVVVDASHPRYWRLETYITSRVSDWIFSRAVRKGDAFDQLWLPSSLQRALPTAVGASVHALGAGFGIPRSPALSARPEAAWLMDDDAEPAEVESDEDDERHRDAPVEEEHQGPSDRTDDKLTFAVGGRRATAVLEAIERSEELRPFICPYRVESRSSDREDGVAIASSWYFGKMTLKGSDFRSLRSYQRRLIHSYGSAISAVAKHRMGFYGSRAVGRRVGLKLNRPSITAAQFEAVLFQRTDVFKLLLTWREEHDGDIRYDAVDMHTGDPLVIDLVHDGLAWRVLLSMELHSCSNAVPRLLANIQQMFDASATCRDFEVPAITALANTTEGA